MKVYRVIDGKWVEQRERDANARYACTTGPDGAPCYREYSSAENARRDGEEREWGAWVQVREEYEKLGRQLDGAAFKEWRRAHRAGTEWAPPAPPRLEQRIEQLEASVKALVEALAAERARSGGPAR